MGVSATGGAAAYATSAASVFKQTAADFKLLGQAVEAGDLPVARQALVALRQDAPWIGRALSASDGDSALGTALRSLNNALQSNDASSAQKAFAELLSVVQSARVHRSAGDGTELPSAAGVVDSPLGGRLHIEA